MSMSTSSTMTSSSPGPSGATGSSECFETDSPVPSLLSRLKAAPLSAFNRKRKVAQNLPHDGNGERRHNLQMSPRALPLNRA